MNLIYSKMVLHGITIVSAVAARLKVTGISTLLVTKPYTTNNLATTTIAQRLLASLKYLWMMQHFQNLWF
jgi:hypothetical protein